MTQFSSLDLFMPRHRDKKPFGNWDTFFNVDLNPDWATRTPSIVLREKEADYLLEVELPGVSEKDTKLEVTQDTLSITATRTQNDTEEKGQMSTFSRTIQLPEDASTEAIEARLKDGLLRIRISKKAESQTKLIPVIAE